MTSWRRVIVLATGFAAIALSVVAPAQGQGEKRNRDQVGRGAASAASQQGFRVQLGDDWLLALHGFLQTRYQAELVGFSATVDSTFALRRARLGAAGRAGTAALEYMLLLEFADGPALLDYYLDYRLRKEVYLRLGQFKTQFTRSFVASSAQMVFTERPGAVEAFRYDRDIGAGVHGLLGGERFGYYAGLGNGGGPGAVNDNLELVAVARGDAVLLGERFPATFGDLEGTRSPSLMIGAGALHDLAAIPARVAGVMVNRDVDRDRHLDNVRVISGSIDAALRFRGLELAIEGLYRREQWGAILDGNPELAKLVGAAARRNYLGFYGEATYMVWPQTLLLGARVGHARLPFLATTGRTSRPHLAERLLEIDAVAQWYRDGYRFLGVHYTLHNFNALEGPDPEGDVRQRIILEAQLAF